MIGAWNVTFLDLSKLAQAAKKINTYKLEILGLAETKPGYEDLQFDNYFVFPGNNCRRRERC